METQGKEGLKGFVLSSSATPNAANIQPQQAIPITTIPAIPSTINATQARHYNSNNFNNLSSTTPISCLHQMGVKINLVQHEPKSVDPN